MRDGMAVSIYLKCKKANISIEFHFMIENMCQMKSEFYIQLCSNVQ